MKDFRKILRTFQRDDLLIWTSLKAKQNQPSRQQEIPNFPNLISAFILRVESSFDLFCNYFNLLPCLPRSTNFKFNYLIQKK